MELSRAIRFASLQEVADSLQSGADPNVADQIGCLPLGTAVSRGDIKIVKLVIEAGADVRARNRNGNSALCQAIKFQRVDLIRLLLDHGADIFSECDCGGVIAAATLINDPALVEMFASMGADVNAYNGDGFTPLMMAAGNDANDVITTLLSRGANVDLRDINGMTAYLHAALIGNVAAGKLLRDAGANLGAITNDGLDAKALAAENGHVWSI